MCHEQVPSVGLKRVFVEPYNLGRSQRLKRRRFALKALQYQLLGQDVDGNNLEGDLQPIAEPIRQVDARLGFGTNLAQRPVPSRAPNNRLFLMVLQYRSGTSSNQSCTSRGARCVNDDFGKPARIQLLRARVVLSTELQHAHRHDESHAPKPL